MRYNEEKPITNGCELCSRVLAETSYQVDYLLELCNRKETHWIEFKAALRPTTNQYSDNYNQEDYYFNVAKALISMINSDGGVLLLGVDDEGRAVGLECSISPGENFEWDYFSRNILSNILDKTKWKGAKKKYTLESGSLRSFATVYKGTLEGKLVAIIIVRPLAYPPYRENPLEVCKTVKGGPAGKFVLFRARGETGRTQEADSYAEIAKYLETRTANSEYFQGLWKDFKKEIKPSFQYNYSETQNAIINYLEKQIINKKEFKEAHACYVDLSWNLQELEHDPYIDFESEDDLIDLESSFSEDTESLKQTETDSYKQISQEIIRTMSEGLQPVLLLGKGGAGKTTVLRYVGNYLAKLYIKDKKYPLPIFINLADHALAIGKHGLPKWVSRLLHLDFHNIDRMLKNGGLSLVLDGYNEVPDDHISLVRSELGDLFSEYGDLPVVIGSRFDLKLEEMEQSFLRLTLRPLEESQAIALLKRRIKSNSSKDAEHQARLLVEKIKKYAIASELLSHPFSLRLLAEMARDIGQDTDSTGVVLRRFAKESLRRELGKDRTRSTCHLDEGAEDVHARLTHIGRQMVEWGVNAIEYYVLNELINKGKQAADCCAGSSLAEKKVINGLYMFSFTHEIIRDYFAAEYFRNHVNDAASFVNLVETQIHKKRFDSSNYRESLSCLCMAAELSVNPCDFMRHPAIMRLGAYRRAELVGGVRNPYAVPALVDYLALEGFKKNPLIMQRERPVQKAAALALASIRSPEARQQLCILSESQDTATRLFATVALGKCEHNTEVTAMLAKRMLDENERVAQKALKAISSQVGEMDQLAQKLLHCYAYAKRKSVKVDTLAKAAESALRNNRDNANKINEKKCSETKKSYIFEALKNRAISPEGLYEDLFDILARAKNDSNAVRNAVLSILSGLGPPIQPPSLLVPKKDFYSGIFYINPKPGVVESDDFNGPVPATGIRPGGIRDGQMVNFIVKEWNGLEGKGFILHTIRPA